MKNIKLFAVAAAAFFIACSASAQNAGTVTNHAFAVGKGAGVTGYTSLLCTSAQLAVGQAAADPICQTITGDVTMTAGGVTAIGATKVTSAMLNADVFSTAHSWAGQQTFTAPVLGTPASGTLTNATGLPIAGITGLATGVGTFLATPSSANLRAALTDEVGTGAAYFVGGALGAPASATLTNATGLPVGGLAPQAAFTFVGNNSSGSASPTAVDISTLTAKASPASTDLMMISDQSAAGAWKKVTVSSVASAGSVSSFNSLTGAVTTNVVVQKFTASGTYTPTSGMLHAIIECKAPGGGGGGALNTSASSTYAGGGGGSGSYSMKRITAADIVGTATITMGAVGSGGVSNANGTAGGTVTVVSNAVTLCSGNGGLGGGFSATTQLGTGGAGGAAGIGDVAVPGQPGTGGSYSGTAAAFATSGAGGSGPFGSGGVGTFAVSAIVNGIAGGGFGAGGSGASASQIVSNGTGGAGSGAIVIITEFVNL